MNIQNPAIRNSRFIFFTTLVVFSFIFIQACTEQKSSTPRYASVEDSTTYVGIANCRNCHEDKYRTFIQTGMGQSFDVASKHKSSAVFSAHSVVRDNYRNLNYYPHWKDDSLLIDEFRLDGRDTVYKRTESVTWIVGSGQHTNSHLTNVNGYVYQVPATFYTQKKHWDLPPGFENGYNSRFSRIIGLECMSCHNAYPKFVEGSENKYDFVANGIDCERCHGPGSEHVKNKLAGNIVDVKKEIDYSIVNPAKLSINLQLDVCQRCHIQGNAVLQKDKSFLDFRPSMKLSDVMDVYMPVFSGDKYEHIMASHAERMKLSKCFIASKDSVEKNGDIKLLKPYANAMTCITCHDPHVSVRQTSIETFNDKCKSCHNIGLNNSHPNAVVHAIQCTAPIEQRTIVNDNCVKCHMPRNGTIDIPHVTNTDHWIRKPVQRDSSKVRSAFAGLACINNSLPSDFSRGTAFLNYYEKFSSNVAFLDSAKKYFSDIHPDSVKSNFESLIRLYFLKNNYQKIVDYTNSINALSILNKKSFTNDNAWTCYRIGEAFSAIGDQQTAVKYFTRCVALAPFVSDFRNKLANAQTDIGQNVEARKNYELIIKENPKYVSAYINYGYQLLRIYNNPEKAEQLYDIALQLDPDNLQALFNKSGLFIYQGKFNVARQFLKKILKIYPNDPRAIALLKQLNENT